MASELNIEYDREGDILYLDVCPPGDDEVMVEVAPGALLRQNTVTGAIEGIEIHGLSRRAAGESGFAVPVRIDLAPLVPAVA